MEPQSSPPPTTGAPPLGAERRTLERPVDGRLLGGVAAGVADYFDVDIVLVRVAFAVLSLVGGIGLPLYLAAWVLIPEEGADRSIAEHLLGRLRAGAPQRPTAAGGAAEGSSHGLPF